MQFLLLIVILATQSTRTWAQTHPYRHYARHSASETIYANQTLANSDDDGNMCHLSLRCPSTPTHCERT